MQRYFVFLFVFLSLLAKASHNRSGEITYKRVAPYTSVTGGITVQVYWYEITVVKYTDDDTPLSGAPHLDEVFDRCGDTLHYGDGTWDYVERGNGTNPLCVGCTPCECDHCGELIIDENGYRVKKNIYYFKHQYPGPGSFLMYTTERNRNAGVENMFQSSEQPFYLESLLVINSFTGPNNSPIFTVDPVDKACKGKCFSHNPGAYDNEHDSLSFKMSAPKGLGGETVKGYSDPGAQPGVTFKIDERSGTLTWCSPSITGEYNIAFVVQEWRKNTSGVYQVIGTVLRDMQVVVRACPANDPPIVHVPQDTCVEAGTLIHKKIRVSDPNSANLVKLSGLGGAFSAKAPIASLVSPIANPYEADFTWQTSCDHIARQPYLTTFKAEDDAPQQKLATYNTFNIRVIPPAIKDVAATPSGTTMKITWSLSSCNPSTNPLVAYKIYRKEGCVPYIFEPCITGVPAASGFIYVGETDHLTSFFIDDNNKDGLVVGQNYSYLVIAQYKDGVQTFGSSPICAKLKRDVPVILNVDVLSTSESGAVRIKWTRPLKTEGNLDTIAFPGPYHFDLKHKSAGVFKTIFRSSADYLYQLDTIFTHSNVNTTLDSNEYLVEFTAKNTFVIGVSQKATSVFLSATPSDRRIDLQWKSKTPWKNHIYTIFRKDPGAAAFVQVGTSTSPHFTDLTNIINKKTYCYSILAEGEYSDPSIYKPLLNNSQELCVTAIDLTPPCTPTLEIEANCPNGRVEVRWQNVRPICSDDVINYILYYKNTTDGTYEKAYEGDTTYYIYDGTSMISGCYAIRAQDENGNLSPLSPDFCIDNCPEFQLPNIFSPNKDGANDFFKAVKVRQVKEIHLVIVDRWGNLVYTTKDPYFEWDGTHIQSKEMVSETTLLYVCTVFEPRVKGTVKRILKGSIQVVR